jgi:hypothetical protein
VTPCCCNPGRGFPTLSIEEMANVLEYRGNNRVFVATPGHCEMRPWRAGKASMLEGLRALGQLQLVSTLTPDMELILGGIMRGAFFPDSVSPPPVGTGGEHSERDLATPITREEMVMTLSRSPPASAEGPNTMGLWGFTAPMITAMDAAWAAFFRETRWPSTPPSRCSTLAST